LNVEYLQSSNGCNDLTSHESTTTRKYQIMVKKYNANKFSIDRIQIEQLQNSNGWNHSTNHESTKVK